MKTIYISSEEHGIPERFDYEEIENKIQVWHIEGYMHQIRTYVGIFNNLDELKDYMIDLEIIGA